MKLAYVTYWDNTNVKSWSGTIFFIKHALENAGIEVIPIDNLHSRKHDLYKIKSVYYKYLKHNNYQRFRELGIINDIAKKIDSELNNINPDVVFSPGSLEISLLRTKTPIVFWSDAVFSGLLNFYPEYQNLPEYIIKNGNYLEQSALDKSKLMLFSSHWAKHTAINDYKVDLNKIKVVPFGANLKSHPSLDDIKNKLNNINYDKFKILFVGVDWYKKGADRLIELANSLKSSSIDFEINIVGCNAPENITIPENIHIHGFIDKSTNEGIKKLQYLYFNSHLFVLPTRAEAYGIVFCEANAFGLPIIAPDIGGIPEIIQNNINGYLVNPNKVVEEITQKAIFLLENPSIYQEMVFNSYNEFQDRLNWETNIKKVKTLIEEII